MSPAVSMRVLVVEDEQKVANALREGLEGERYEVVVERTGEGAYFRLNTEKFDTILLDLTLPGRDGLEILKAVRARGLKTPVLVLTARDTIEDRVSGLDSGADDYLVKPFAHDEMLARVRALLRRASPDAGEPLAFGGLSLDPGTMVVSYQGQTFDLTALEFRLLEYFMTNQRIVLSRSRLLLAVWDLDTETTSNVVDVYVGYLRQKLGPDGAGRLLQTVRGVGYVLREPA